MSCNAPAFTRTVGGCRKMIRFHLRAVFGPMARVTGPGSAMLKPFVKQISWLVEIQGHLVRRHHLRAGVHQRIKKIQTRFV